MQLSNEFDSTTISELSAPPASGEKCSTTKFFQPYNLRCFLKITPQDVARMNCFERQVYEQQAENLVSHCEEEIGFIGTQDDLIKKTSRDIALLKAGIVALDESIQATNAKIEEINELKKDCLIERAACINVKNTWNKAQESFSANIARILDQLQAEVDARESLVKPMKLKK